MEVEGFGVSNLELERFFKCNGENLSNNFVGVFPAGEKREFINEIQHNDKAKYEKLTQKELNSLSSTAQHFFKFLYKFGTYKKIKNTVKVVTVDDNLQSFSTDYCGLFQLYFYLNLFEPLNTSIVAKKSTRKLDIKLIGELLNELCNTKTHQNERILDTFILQHGFEFDKISDQKKEESEAKNSDGKNLSKEFLYNFFLLFVKKCNKCVFFIYTVTN